MSYRVLIPTAGIGSRLGGLTKFLNKSLVSIANRPILSHIIEKFPNDVEFVIALGHKGELVKEFIQLAYPERRFYFAEVSPFEGPGSGLGLSILKCKEYLQQPFIFLSCDTLVSESIPNLSENWMGYANLSLLEPYRTVEVNNGIVQAICEKGIGKVGSHKPYIGLAGIKDYKLFWQAMEEGGETAINNGEVHGLREILKKGIKAYQFIWNDTGNQQGLDRAREIYKEPDEPNILEKANEAIWFINGNVIKFSDDQRFIANRVARVKELGEFVPKVTNSTKHMYCYTKNDGEVLSKVITLPMFDKLLIHSNKFWSLQSLSDLELKSFRNSCMKFYKDKTFERVELFYKNFNKEDGTEMINGVKMPSLKKLLENLDWDWIADGLPGRFHGDFHFENILFNKNENKFIFLDWRQEFSGSLNIGDVYYDLAKLLHGLIICHELIVEDYYWIDWQKDSIAMDFHRKQILVDCERFFSEWLTENGYDKKKVYIMTALVYLNIAALHHYPYSLLLYALGKQMLFKESIG